MKISIEFINQFDCQKYQEQAWAKIEHRANEKVDQSKKFLRKTTES